MNFSLNRDSRKCGRISCSFKEKQPQKFGFDLGSLICLILSCMSSLFWKLIFCWLHHLEVFSPTLQIVFSLLFMVFFAKTFKFNQVLFIFISITLGDRFQLCDLCQCFFCLFSSRSFIVPSLTFTSLIHFEFFCTWCQRMF